MMMIRFLIPAGLALLLGLMGNKAAAQTCSKNCNGQNRCCKIMDTESKINTGNEDFTPVEACHLTAKEQGKRYQELKSDLFKRIASVKELGDGFELVFKEDIGFATQLIEFVNFERVCCPTFAFELRFEPQAGPIHLTIRGAKGIKDIIALGLQENGF